MPEQPRQDAKQARDSKLDDPPWVADFFGSPERAAAEDPAEDLAEDLAEAPVAGDEPSSEPADAIPERERDNELLVEPPFGEHHLGRLGGYRSGVRQRRRLSIAIAVALLGSMIAGFYYIRYLEQFKHYEVFELPPDAELKGRPRVMTWSDGKARFGLHRAPPGVHTIELPDRSVHLADGCDRAQVRVNIVDGETVELTVITGDVTVKPRK